MTIAARCFLSVSKLILWLLFTLLNCILFLPYKLAELLRSSRGGSCFSTGGASDQYECAIPPRTVVIVGGNFAGLAALRNLLGQADFSLILIDQHDYFEYTPGILRLFCDPNSFGELAGSRPTGRYRFILGTVNVVNSDHVLVSCEDGSSDGRIDFDYLILCTGSNFQQPITPSVSEYSSCSRAEAWSAEATRLQSAQTVIVIGGGAVGVELAAEIACHFPEKNVTLVNGNIHLVPTFPQKTIDYVEKWFRAKHVELFLGEALKKWDDKSCTFKSGRKIEADIVYVCIGSKCNSDCISEGEFASSLNEKKAIQVNESLQVEGHSNVFAAGDVMIHPSQEIKQAYYAEMNGKMAAYNVLRLIKQLPLLKYPDYLAGAAAMPFLFVVTLGRYDGSLGFNNSVWNGAFAALMKWIIQWTKVKEMGGHPVGDFVWLVGDEMTFALARCCFKPFAPGQ